MAKTQRKFTCASPPPDAILFIRCAVKEYPRRGYPQPKDLHSKYVRCATGRYAGMGIALDATRFLSDYGVILKDLDGRLHPDPERAEVIIRHIEAGKEPPPAANKEERLLAIRGAPPKNRVADEPPSPDAAPAQPEHTSSPPPLPTGRPIDVTRLRRSLQNLRTLCDALETQ